MTYRHSLGVLLCVVFLYFPSGVTYAAPAIPVPIAPLGEITTDSPEFVWQDQDDVTEFRLWLYDRSLKQRVHVQNYDRADICSNGICTVQSPHKFGFGVKHLWYVRGRQTGVGYGDWSKSQFDFPEPVAQVIQKVSLLLPVDTIDPGSSIFSWEHQPGVHIYRLFVRDLTDAKTLHLVNHNPADVCSGAVCQVALPNLPLVDANRLHFRVRAWAPGGWNDWSDRNFFTANLAPQPAVAVDDMVTLTSNVRQFDIPVLDNDTGDIDTSTVDTNVQPTAGLGYLQVDSQTGIVTFTAYDGVSGTDYFGYTVKNSDGVVSNIATVEVVIEPPAIEPVVASNDSATVSSGDSVQISVLANDTGAIDPATIDTNVAPQAQSGTLSVNAVSGDITYTAYTGISGTDQFGYTVQATDGTVSNIAIVSVTINGGSTVSLAANDDIATVDDGESVVVDVLANDTGAIDASTVDTNVDPQAGKGYLAINTTTGAITYTAYDGVSGTDKFGYTVSALDGTLSNSATVTVTINSGTGTVLAANDDSATTSAGSPVDIPVLANDTGTLVYSSLDTNVSPAPTLGFLALNESTGVITYTPYAGSTGTDTFGYRVSDTSGAVSDVATVTVTIGSGSGGTLLAVDDSASTTDGTAVEIFVLANDNGNPLASSVDTNVSPAAEFGYLALDEFTGALTYTPYPGNTGTDTFGYRVSDSSGAVSNVAVVTVTVGDPVNQPPQTVDDAFSLDINTFADFDVLQNDSDDSAIDATTLVIDTSQLTKGSAEIVAGNVRYTNTDGTAGTDTFTYTVKDDAGLISGVATVVVTVMDPAPAANDDSATLIAWEDVTIDVLANDTINGVPVDPPATSIIVETQPLYGTVTFEGSQLNYAHDGTQATSDSFTYSIEDAAQNTSNIATVIITITPHPDVAPEAADDLFSLVRDTARLIPVLSNDIDRNYDLDLATLTIVTAPVNGDASVQNGQIFYDHDGSANASDSITYRISDAGGRSDEAVVTISYEPVQAPLAQDDSVWIDQQGGTVTIAVLDNDTTNTALDVTSILITDDADNDDDSAFVVNDDGTIAYKHSGDGSIEDSFSYIVRNVQGLDSNEATVHIRIKPRLFAINELSFMGAFSLPADTFGQSSANYAQGVIEANGSSLFFVGHDQEDAIAEFTIPYLTGSYEIGHLTSAGNPVQNFSRVLNRISGGNPEGLDQIVGLEKVGDSLVVNVMEYYDGAGNNTNTTFVIDSAHDLSGSSVSALHQMDGAARSAGWLSEIPYFWQQELGATYISGNASGDPIISRLSVGPSAFAIDLPGTPSSSTSQQITAQELQGFSLANPLNADLDNASGNNDLWTHLSTARYGFVVPGTRTYMTVGWSGGHDSGVSYKPVLENGQACPGFCANDSEDVYNHYWLWDMDDWLRVKNGEISPNQITPYDYGKFNLPFQTGPYVNEIGGASYDSATGLLYLSVLDANAQGFDNPPVIVAFNIGSPVSLPGDAIALAPQGEVTIDNPAFRWQEAANSDYYRLQIIDKTTASVVDEFVYDSAQICAGGVCEVVPIGLKLPHSSNLIFKVRGENAFAIGAWDVLGFSYSGVGNQPPVANAGVDITEVQGVDIVLDGSASSDADGTIVSYVWTTNGSQVGIGQQPVLSGLTAGVYTINLTVTDDTGATDSDSVFVTVNAVLNQLPIANAGDDQDALEGDDVTLDGSGSSDPDGGTIVSYVWTDVGGTEIGTGVSPTLTGLPVGDNTIQLEVTDNEGATATDTVVISVIALPNQPPIADAGSDQTIDEGNDVTLDGSGSSDPDGGTIVSYVWTDAGGTEVGTGVSPTLTGLPVGDNTIQLEVTDNEGATATDTVVIKVTAIANEAPIADAGDDQDVLEGDDVTLDGSGSTDPDGGTIVSYVWTDAGGTEVGTGVSPTVTGLPVGDNTIQLEVTDNEGATATDTVVIKVTAVANEAPIANAGDDQDVLEGDDVILDGSGSTDPDGGTIVSYVWTDAGGTEVGTGVSPTVTGLPVGVNTISLVVTDDAGATGTDLVTITVTPLPNQAPVAEAGPDQSVVEGDDVTLDGSGSTDPDGGTIVSYVWTDAGGNEVGTGVSPTVTGLPVGVNTISLVVTDDAGATGTDLVTITVTPLPNQAPVAEAGPDQSVVEGDDVTLDGSGSTDPDGGTIVSYVWTDAGGTEVGTGVSPTLTGLTVGVYTMDLLVTDDGGATGTDFVVITVTDAPNEAPVAVDDNINVTAGIDTTIDILGNDFDPNDNSEIDVLSFTVDTDPASGEGVVTQQPDGTISYEIARDTTVVIDSFTYTISDNTGDTSNTATVTVNINVPPVAVDDTATVLGQQLVQILVTDNDSDANGAADIDNGSVEIVTGQGPSSGTLTIQNGAITYANTDATATTDSFQYIVIDAGGAESDPATVTITIEPLLTGLTAIHRDGQTFLTWDETGPTDQYHVYRSDAPITPATLAQATRVTTQWGPLSSTTSNNVHGPWNRCVSASLCIPQNFVIEDNGQPLTDDTGLFVYTTQSGEAGDTYYAVTSVVGGVENTSTVMSFSNAITESVSQPTDVIAFSNGNDVRIYTQFMDYQDWNPTFNGYAYNYGVVLPDNYNPGQSYPLLLEPHAYGDTMITVGRPESDLKFPGWDFIQIHPHDPGFQEGGAVHSWWYGYAANHNYESQGSIPSSGRIENFTEQRLMRAIDAVIASPRYNVDEDLIHAYGHSMGASGSLALGMRYPSVISGIYASQPMTDYAASPLFQPEFVQLWGTQQSALNILNSGPRSQDISLYGSPVAPINVWDWMDHQQQLIDRRGDDFAYLMYSHGKPDETINWETQGQPTIQAFTAANAGFSAKFNEQTHSFSSFNSVVPSLFGLDSSDFTWKYPLDLSFPAIQNASGSGPLVPTSNINIVDSYNLNIEWATPHTVDFSGNIIDQPDLYQITIRSTDAPQTADITPRRTQRFDPDVGQQCGWTAIDNNTGQVLGSGNSTVDVDSLVTIPDVNITTGAGTRLRIDC